MKAMLLRVAATAALVMAGVGLGLGVPGTRAHDDDNGENDNNDDAQFVYAVKVICEPDFDGEGPPETAIFNVTTSINVHNPNRKAVRLVKKGIALEDDQEPKRPGDRQHHTLRPDYALQMGCEQIKDLGAKGSTGFGDVVIESKSELDVWAVYFTRAVGIGVGGAVFETDVVRVPPTKVSK